MVIWTNIQTHYRPFPFCLPVGTAAVSSRCCTLTQFRCQTMQPRHKLKLTIHNEQIYQQFPVAYIQTIESKIVLARLVSLCVVLPSRQASEVSVVIICHKRDVGGAVVRNAIDVNLIFPTCTFVFYTTFTCFPKL